MSSLFTPKNDLPVSFGHKLATSPAFMNLFREGMALVEEAAAYLDGPGREESRKLSRLVGLAYASESMRLTTRLMQVASWLLLQRAVNEGEMSQVQARTEKHRVRLSRQDFASAPEVFEKLPEKLRSVSLRSMRLQERVMHLDRLISTSPTQIPGYAPRPVQSQIERLRMALNSDGCSRGR